MFVVCVGIDKATTQTEKKKTHTPHVELPAQIVPDGLLELLQDQALLHADNLCEMAAWVGLGKTIISCSSGVQTSDNHLLQQPQQQ